MQAQRVKIYGNIVPYPWQKAAHDLITSFRSKEKTARTIVIKAARQRYGKSAFVKAELLRFALSDEGSISSYVSPKLNLARKMYKEIKRSTSPLIKNANGQDISIEFTNGSVINFYSEGQGEALRGHTTTGINIIDEGSSFKDATYYELIAPWSTVHKALTVITSTPKYETGFFWDSCQIGLSGSNPYYTFIDWVEQYGSQCQIPAEDLAKKPNMPHSKWIAEYEGRFMKAESAVFGDFSKCLISAPNPNPKEVYLGLDFSGGTGNDYTVLTAFDESANMLFTWSTNNLSPTEQIKEITRIVTPIKAKVKRFNAESNSIGITYIDMLRKNGFDVTKFVTTNDSKRNLVEKLQVAISQGKIGILNEPDVVTQLAFFERKVSNGKVSYSAPSGMHDDYVMSLMIAFSGLDKSGFSFFTA